MTPNSQDTVRGTTSKRRSEQMTPAERRIATIAEAIIVGIHQEMPDVVYFTREDLLQLDCLNGVATITRYHYVCRAVGYCINRKWMYPMTNTQLILTGGIRRYNELVKDVEAYKPVVLRCMPKGDFRVGDILEAWEATSDQFLSYNAKRTYVREILRRMERDGEIETRGVNLWRKA